MDIKSTYWVTQKVPQIYTANHATFPIRIRKITEQIYGNFWVTQYLNGKLSTELYMEEESDFQGIDITKTYLYIYLHSCLWAILGQGCWVILVDIRSNVYRDTGITTFMVQYLAI